MNSNIIPAVIIASAILICGIFVCQEMHSALGFSPEDLLQGIDRVSKAKDEKGDSRLKNSVSRIVAEVASGIKDGFTIGIGVRGNHAKSDLSGLEVREVHCVNGRMDNEEKVIGLIHNGSKNSYEDLSLSIIVRDRQGKLIDVIGESPRIEGVLLPNKDIGFSVNRESKPYGDKDEVKASRPFSAEVAILSGSIAK